MIYKKADLENTNRYGHSPLLSAARVGNSEAVQLLIDESVKVDVVDSEGMNAVQIAIQNKNFDLVRLLLESGVNTDIKIEDQSF